MIAEQMGKRQRGEARYSTAIPGSSLSTLRYQPSSRLIRRGSETRRTTTGVRDPGPSPDFAQSIVRYPPTVSEAVIHLTERPG